MAAGKNNEPVRWPRILALLIVGVLGCELIGQAFIVLWAGRPYESLAPYRWSPYGLIRNNPELTSPSYSNNENGFRNLEDFTREKPPDTLRVVMLGASVLYSGIAGTDLTGSERVDSGSTVAQYLAQEMRADPELAGLEVEVLNAGANFNRIVEVSTSYIAEYALWQPDLVVVLGSANNFRRFPNEGDVLSRNYRAQQLHPWHLEFERQANRHTFQTALEHVRLSLEERLASAGILRKLLTRSIDKSFDLVRPFDLRRRYATAGPEIGPASWEEFDLYVDEYLGHVEAMAGVARRHGQELSLFWEYFLSHLDGIKPFTEEETIINRRSRDSTYEIARRFNFYARDRVAEYCREAGIPFIDPLPALEDHDGRIFIDYLHYTREGNRFMANWIYAALREQIHERARTLRSAPPESLE